MVTTTGTEHHCATRGNIVMVSLDPATPNDADDRRPVIVVSNNGANRAAWESGRGVITVVPLTSNVDWVNTFQVLIPRADSGLRKDSKAQVDQVRAISVLKLGRPVGELSDRIMNLIDEALRLHLDL